MIGIFIQLILYDHMNKNESDLLIFITFFIFLIGVRYFWDATCSQEDNKILCRLAPNDRKMKRKGFMHSLLKIDKLIDEPRLLPKMVYWHLTNYVNFKEYCKHMLGLYHYTNRDDIDHEGLKNLGK